MRPSWRGGLAGCGQVSIGLRPEGRASSTFGDADSSSSSQPPPLTAQYRIVDGELQLRGPSLFAGYLAEGGDHVDAELTAANHDDGWFRTGDLAEAEGDRSFEYIARMGDVLRLGGFLVSPAEIEAVLLDDPDVNAVQVVAVDQPTGARPVGFVVLAAGSEGDFDQDAAIARCQERLARYKVPVRVLVVDEFPTTAGPNGTKIQKNRLRDMAAEALAVD